MLKNRRGFFAMMLCIATAVSIVSLWPRQGIAQAPAPAPAAQIVKWEYAIFSVDVVSGLSTYTLNVGDWHVSGATFEDFAKKAGVTGKICYPAVLTSLGNAGWELVAIDRHASGSGFSDNFYFKRRAN